MFSLSSAERSLATSGDAPTAADAPIAPLAELVADKAQHPVGIASEIPICYKSNDLDALVTSSSNNKDRLSAEAVDKLDIEQIVQGVRETENQLSTRPVPMARFQQDDADTAAHAEIANNGLCTAPTVFITESTASARAVSTTARCVTGPIIGLTSEHSVRFLLEVNHSMIVIVRCELIERHVRQSRHKATQSPSHAPDVVFATSLGSKSQNTGESSTDQRSSPATQQSPTESAQVQQDSDAFEQQVLCEAFRIRPITFTQLHPDCRYRLVLKNVEMQVSQSTFCTMPTNFPVDSTTPFRLALVSCNLVSVTRDLKDKSTDLWLDLERRVKRDEFDLCLHMGDQIYSDEKRSLSDDAQDTMHVDDHEQLVFRLSLKMIKDLPHEQWPAAAMHIKELYRQLYRDTWSHPPTAYVLANLPSLMIADDHEYRDDFGCQPADSDPTTAEYFIGRCAHTIVAEYQRSLWDNVDYEHLDACKKDFHFHAFGGHGIAMLDLRGPLSLHKLINDPFPYLGSLQWTEIKAAMSDGGIFHDTSSLLMVCPAPIVFLPTSINDLLGNTVIDDALGHWSSKPYKAEQIMMLNLCQQWKEAKPGRELTFLGGDVHVGGCTSISRHGNVVFQQFITSSISNFVLSQFQFMLGELAKDLITELEDGWSFKHSGFTGQRNCGLLTVTADEIGPVISTQHVTPEGVLPVVSNRIGLKNLESN